MSKHQNPQIHLIRNGEGPIFSRIVAGMMNLASWSMSPKERLNWIEAAIEMGFNTFDHADIYSDYTSERLFGEAIALNPSIRKKISLISKCGIKLISPNWPEHRVHAYDTSRAHIISSVENSLRNLQTDHLDLLLIHRPSPLLDADEVAWAFNSLKESGKVVYFGVSNFKTFQFDLLQSRLDFPLVTNQVEFSLLSMTAAHDGTLDQCQKLGVAPMVWSPVAGGRIFRPLDEQSRRVHRCLSQLSQELGGVGLDQIALAWILKHPSRPLPIMGTGKLERLQAAVESTALELTNDQWFMVWEASAGQEVP